MEVIIKGKGNRISLGTKEFKASGGQAQIFVKGSTAFKVYHDAAKMIPVAKMQEFGALTLPQIIKPMDILLDTHNTPIGYTMLPLPDDVYSLCTLFPKTFRTRNNVTPDMMLDLVRKLQECVKHAHSHGMLMVDINEMNFLVDKKFDTVFCVDVDSYKTRSFPSNALMFSVWDRVGSGGKSVSGPKGPEIQGAQFTEGTDWFSFGIVSFQMFVGIHPFKGQHAKYTTMDDRMLHNCSVLDPSVGIPASVLPFDVIPDIYRQWYKAVFQDGKRLAPPDALHGAIIIIPTITKTAGSNNFNMHEIFDVLGDVTYSIYNSTANLNVTVTTAGTYIGKGRVTDLPMSALVGFTPRYNRTVGAWIENGIVKFRDLNTRADIPSTIGAEQLMETDGRLYAKNLGTISEIDFVEVPNNTLVSPKIVANVMKQSTRLFEGVAVQAVLGGYCFSIFPKKGQHFPVRIVELDDNYKIINAKYMNQVLMVVAEKNGKYDRFVIRFGPTFGDKDYDVRIVADISAYEVNFVVLDQGVAIAINENDEVEMFSNRKLSSGVKIIKDQTVDSSCKLFKQGSQALFARAGKLVQFSMK